MAKIADVITIDYASPRVLIDGEALPWHVANDIRVTFDRGLAMVTVTIPAERVEHVPPRHGPG